VVLVARALLEAGTLGLPARLRIPGRATT
jgi:hypothetical protein